MSIWHLSVMFKSRAVLSELDVASEKVSFSSWDQVGIRPFSASPVAGVIAGQLHMVSLVAS